MRRFVVAEMSMAPALLPGDRILARRLRRPRTGDVVLFRHPHRDDFWLVKRIAAVGNEEITVDGHSWHVPEGHVFVLSDAAERTRADSRTFGPLPAVGMYVAAFRYRKGSRRDPR